MANTKTAFRYYVIVACVIVTITIAVFFVFKSNNTLEENHQFALRSQYVMQNPQGDVVYTWAVWLKVKGDRFHIHVLNSPEITSKRLNVIDNVLFSDMTYSNGSEYSGWNSVLSSLSNVKTHFLIPNAIHTDVTDIGEGDIVISFTNERNPDGYNGFTKMLVDEKNHEILKAEITIYKVDSLSSDDLALILRHELGHGLGLGHSDTNTDLMNAVIQREDPYISQCDINALIKLYNGSDTIAVKCN
ncbi:MAG TPA: matrixin family metalloprotease [Nitrosopumilaceae archaeon]|nr:matrixin family metalloprotease [Nitrosopumilaceae archaeon]